jgi:hypothetical protein
MLHYQRTRTGGEHQVDQTITIDPFGASLRHAAFPLPLDDVQGRIVVADGCVTLDDVRARHGDAKLSFDGRIQNNGTGTNATCEVRIRGMPFSEPLRQAVPWRWRKRWNDVRPSGTFDLALTPLTYESNADAPSCWTFAGAITLQDFDAELGANLTAVNGAISGLGSVTGAHRDLGFTGELALDHVAVHDRSITDVHGTIVRSAESGSTVVDHLTGHIYGGTATGRIELRQDGSRKDYAAETTLQKVDLRGFLNAGRPKGKPPLNAAGMLRARVYLSGSAGYPNSKRGGGRVHIDRARVFQLPLMASVVDAMEVEPPPANAAQVASAEFFLQGPQIQVKDIVLRDPVLTMIGSGVIQRPENELDITMISVSPREWGRVPVLTELLEGTSRELMEIHVRGTLRAPAIQADPLRGVGNAIEILIQPQQPWP